MEPASIRYKNPGAMWGRTGQRPSADKEVATNNPLALKWGSTQTFYLSDGLGQGNNIAVFPSYVQGICAQLDLWRSSAHYRNKRFADAIATWSGGNYVESYITFVLARVPGMTRDTVMDDAFWRSPRGVGFLKAQAWHEAGKQYPAADDDWTEAQRRVMGGVVAQPSAPKPAPEPAPSPKPAPAPVPKPAPPSPQPIPAAHKGGIVAVLTAAVAGAWKFAQSHPLETAAGAIAAAAAIVLIVHLARNRSPS